MGPSEKMGLISRLNKLNFETLILQVMLKRDLIEYPFAWVYIGVGLILALVELITVVLACAYVAQINRRQRHQRMYTRAATADDDGKNYLPGLHSSSHETNF